MRYGELKLTTREQWYKDMLEEKFGYKVEVFEEDVKISLVPLGWEHSHICFHMPRHNFNVLDFPEDKIVKRMNSRIQIRCANEGYNSEY